MKTLTISLKTIRAALARAAAVSDDWQAECCEIAMIPAVARRLAELNTRHFPRLTMTRHEGKPHQNMRPEDNLAVKDWTVYAGYVLLYNASPPGPFMGWNAVRADYYSHSPGTAWNGLRREAISEFIHDLRMIAHGHDHPESRATLDRAGIRLTAPKTAAVA